MASATEFSGRDTTHSKIIFYKIFTNLGITQKPNKQEERNDGVYGSSEQILTPAFVANYPSSHVEAFRFTKNREVRGEDVYDKVAKESLLCCGQILSHCRREDRLVVVGGDNTIVLPALLADSKRFHEKNIGVITFDTHGDMHQSSSSPSGNIHGTYMRAFFDTFDRSELETLVTKKLSGEDIIYFGNFDFEKEEIAFMDQCGIPRFSSHHLRQERDRVGHALSIFLKQHEHIFVNFDIDVFDVSLVKATGITNNNGLMREDVFPLLDRIAEHPSVTISLSEVSIEKEGAAETVAIAQEVIRKLCR